MKTLSQRNTGAAAPGGPLREDEGEVPIVQGASAARSAAAILRQLWQRPRPSHRAWARAASMARLTPPTELRSVASYGGIGSTGTSLRFKLRSKDRPYEIIMKDIKRLARNFFTEEEYAQFIEEQKALLAHEPDTESDLPPLIFMLFMHDIYGLSRDEMGIVDGSVRLTLKAGKRIAQQRLRESDVTPDLQDQIMDIIQVIESHEE